MNQPQSDPHKAKKFIFNKRTVKVQPPRSHNVDMNTSAWSSQVQGVIDQGIYTPHGLNKHYLQTLSKTIHVASIINMRVVQVDDFTKPQIEPTDIGWRLGLRNRFAIPTAKDRRDMMDAAAFIERGAGPYMPGGMSTLMKIWARDTLTYDLIVGEPVFEVGATGRKKPFAIVPADPKTIVRMYDDELLKHGRADFTSGYAQIVDGRLVQLFEPDEFIYAIRRPRSDIRTAGQGYPELEELHNTIVSLVNATLSNQQKIVAGSHAEAALVLEASWKPERFAAWKAEVFANQSGPLNNRRMLISQLNPAQQEKLSVLNFGRSNTEMEFTQWITWLTGAMCSMFGVTQSEMDFLAWTQNSQRAPDNVSPLERMIASKERGLRSILRTIQSIYDEIVSRYWPRLCFQFGGFDIGSEKDKHEMDMQSVTTWDTPNEIRIKRNKPPLNNPIADLPLNALFVPLMQRQLDDPTARPTQYDIDSVGTFIEGRRVFPDGREA
jgi:hypothetical protein